MLRSQVLSNARFAGQTLRYHTWPIHRQQSVGEHTWQCCRIYWQIFGPLPPEASTYLIWHDAGELAVGDLPFPVKAQNPTLKAKIDWLEEEAVVRMGGPISSKYDEVIKRRAKCADLIEMWEMGHTELLLGNKFAKPIIDDIRKAIQELPLTPDDAVAVEAYLNKFLELCVESN